jgi:catechol 2,3-dioxygenase-like lactoylglutathione lyase family enzyme
MDALHPRLLTADFPAMFAFYDTVLTAVAGAQRTRGDGAGPYASWDVDGQGVLSLFDRAAMAAATGTAGLPAQAPPAQDRAALVGRVPDVVAAYAIALRHGGTPVAEPADRPEWGPGLRTAHVRDPEGNLLEFQSY